MTTFRTQYDPAKNVANKKKHKVSLADAEAVFYDEMALEREDNDHDESGGLSWGKTPAVVYSSLHTPTVSQISFVFSAHD
nr:BrnT family toxin [Pseudomonas sp. Pdm06]